MLSEKTEQTPLARLVIFMICLAIAGSIVAGAHYAFVDLPAQASAAVQPSNALLPAESCSAQAQICASFPIVAKQLCNAWTALWCT